MKTYEEVAKTHNLPLDTAERYVLYMKRRWADEEEIQCQTGYAEEWAERFMAGIEFSASDSEGKRILREIDNLKQP